VPAVPLILTNQGVFNAGFSGGSLTIGDALLIGSSGLKDQGSAGLNQGTLGASNGDTLTTVTGKLINPATGTLSATHGGTLTIDSFKWANAGTIVESNGALDLGSNFTLASIGKLSRSGGTVNITGTLDNTSTTLEVSASTSLGTLAVQGGTIKGGTIHDHGLGLVAPLPLST